MKRTFFKKSISLLLTLLIAVSGIVPAVTAFAGDGVEGYYDLQIFYKETGTMVPTYMEDNQTEHIETMFEGDELELEYRLIDSVWPDNGYVKWYSENPALVDVTSEGVVKAFDSSKGAVVQLWIDNEVKTIPLVGSLMAKALEKALFNEYIDLDSMDTEEIVEVVVAAFGSDSILSKYIEAYQGQLVDSLREYLDKVNTGIYCQLFDKDGNKLAEDKINVTIKKCEEWYAAFLPNGTHITNKAQINTTQAVGAEVQLSAITTPRRLGFGTVYSVKSSSIFTDGKVVATVNDSGLVTFKNTGTVTILVSPDSEDVIEALLAFINKFYELQNTGTIDTDKVAGILIDYIGIDMNRTVLAALLDVAFAIKDIAGDAADPVQLTATAVEIIANIILQMKYNDSITFNVVEAKPITNFDIEGANTVKEGTQIKLDITNVQPDAGDTTDITWSSSDPTVACVDPKTGVITGLDAGGSLGNLSSQTCEITATSAANNVSKTVTLTVTGKTGKYISSAFIDGPEQVMLDGETDYSYIIYPKRVAESDNLYISWGMQTDTDEDGNPVYTWADSENPVNVGIAEIDANGHYKALDGGHVTLAMKAVTGYYLSNGNFYEISSFIATKDVMTGIPVEKIHITCVDGTSNGDKNRDNIVTINGDDYEYVTIKKGVMEGYAGNGGKFTATVEPANATNQTLTWVVDNNYYQQKDLSEDTHSVSYTQKAGHEVADTFNVYAVSNDGTVISNVVTVCVTRNYVTNNVIDQDVIEVVNGKQTDATHTLTFDGSWDGTAYACYKANWYSSDEDIFSVQTKTNDNRDATVTGNDVGEATLYCVSADGGIVDTATVVVKPDKQFLEEIVDLCDNANITRTAENKKLYQQYMKRLDLAYAVLYDQDMASQTTCDTYAQNLLTAFYKLGGFVGIGNVEILGTKKTPLQSKYKTVKLGTTGNYSKATYDFDYTINPKSAMYSDVEWTSSNPNISVDENGICSPNVNDPCSAKITLTITDYMGNSAQDSVYISFAKTVATGLTLEPSSVTGGKVGETKTISPVISPTNVLGNSTASCKDVVWKSTDESVATVDEKGVVTFLYGGDCEIICTTMDGGYTATCPINVVTNYDYLQLLVNQYTDQQLNPVNFYPDSWNTFTAAMNEAKALLSKADSSQKEVDAMAAKLENAYNSLEKYNYIQNVELYLDGEQTAEFYQYDLSLLKEGISYKNAVLDLNVRLYPNNASYKDVKWESSTTAISVTTDGKCSPTANECCYGQITCTVTDHFGNSFTDSVWVSFSYYPVTALVLSDTNINGAVGKTHQLLCTVEPTGSSLLHVGKASIQDYYWESLDESVATVDENGLVTFVDAGSTIVRAVSYDGGVTGECVVSTEGDRSALKEALEKYGNIDYSLYDYNYKDAFIKAYQNAELALNNLSLSQAEIDEAAAQLNQAGENMTAHPYILVDSIALTYTTYKRNLVNTSTQVASGTIGSNDAVSVNLSSNYSNYNNYNDIVITAAPQPADAMYKSIQISVDESSNIDKPEIGSNTVKISPSKQSEAGYAKITVKTTDHYDRETIRTVYVVMADKTVTGISVSPASYSMMATDVPKTINATISGSPEISAILWSSSDDSIVSVDQNGVMTPHEKGTAIITAKTVDGGYSATVKVSVYADFNALATKVDEYTTLINDSTGHYIYTQDSLNTLKEVVSEAKVMVDEGKATQKEADAMYKKLEDAYNALERYIAVMGVDIGFEEAANVSEPNKGYIRYKATTINGKQIQLVPNFEPGPNAKYKSVTWESSNENVEVDSFGLVTNKSSAAKYAVITCTVEDDFSNIYSASAVVSFVRYAATGVTFDSEIIYGAPQETKKLAPNLNVENTLISSSYVDECKYSSSNPEVATVDAEGNVTFISQGTSIITVTSCDGGFTGTIQAYTTWDTTALQEAIALAENIEYTDYAYEQGMAFKSAYENANTVYADIHASQQTIDDACAQLTTAVTNLEGHEFVYAEPSITVNEKQIEDGISYELVSGKAVIEASHNADAMVKSAVLSYSDASGLNIAENGSQLILTKTAEEDGTVSITYTVTDAYDRVTEYTYAIKIVDEIINIDSINLTVNGAEITEDSYTTTGYKTGYTDFAGLYFGYLAYPGNATEPVSVEWTSSATNFVTVSETGFVNLTSAGKIRRTNTALITCTVTNADGTTVSKSVNLTIGR